MNFIRNFMLVIGPISSAFDFLTFYVMISVLKANETLFQTGWFVESLSTQVLVIFIIRTRGNPFKSRAHPVLTITSLSFMAIGTILPFTSLGTYFGFVPPPMEFYAIFGGMVNLSCNSRDGKKGILPMVSRLILIRPSETT
jgi:Mg2+-importing ATPase